MVANAPEVIVPEAVNAEVEPGKDGGNAAEVGQKVGEIDPRDADKILENPKELKKQIKALNSLRSKYEKGKLGEKSGQYENLMNNIRSELDATIPTIIEMNEEIDINYYMKHPEAAKKEAEKIVSNYENMGTVELVGRVLKKNKYLKEESKQKLYKVVHGFDEDIKSLLGKKQKIVDATVNNMEE